VGYLVFNTAEATLNKVVTA